MDIKTRLEKDTYNAGETAKGTLLIKTNKVLKVRKFKFSVCGKERYEVGHTSLGITKYDMIERPVEKYDIFFFEDLSAFLKSINVSLHNNDSTEIPEGDFAIPFHFSIPHNALESYHGRDIRIVYEVGISADIGRWKKDYHHILSFKVLNPNMTYTFGGDRLFLGDEQEKKEGEPYLGLELANTNGINDVPKFSPSQIIRGRLKIASAIISSRNKVNLQDVYSRYLAIGNKLVFSNT